MSPEENAAMLLGRIDQLSSELSAEERLLLDQAARLNRVRREIAVARSAVAEIALAKVTNYERRKTRERRTA